MCVQDGAGPFGGGDSSSEEPPPAGWFSHHLWLCGAETEQCECGVSLPDAWLHNPTACGQRYRATHSLTQWLKLCLLYTTFQLLFYVSVCKCFAAETCVKIIINVDKIFIS